ncbi:MAG: hypothetical protein HYY06_30840 [Deltaproteobacteria bacterium]|nr:hypothetical protein [Deltaproteobacteria bacterium]
MHLESFRPGPAHTEEIEMDWLWIAVAFAVWWALQAWVLPRLGVST